jgi:hypothetical protein
MTRCQLTTFIRPHFAAVDADSYAHEAVCRTTGVKLRGPEGAQRPRAPSASTSEFGSILVECRSVATIIRPLHELRSPHAAPPFHVVLD